MKEIAFIGLVFATFTALTGCGGGDSSDNGNNQSNNKTTATDTEIIGYLNSSNINFNQYNRAPGTWRWLSTPEQHVLVYIPTPISGNAIEQDYANKVQNSIRTYNSKLTGLLVLEATNSIPIGRNYIHVSYGTGYVPPGSTDYNTYCSNVSTGPYLGNVIQPSNQNGIGSNPVYVNLGNGHCDVTQDIVTHEFGHALGLEAHFGGFGTGDATSTAMWDVLATLYGNPPATISTNLIVKRAAN